ncbi:MAG TPA: hypothetical protein VFX30_10995 [bacterium]|nr:hypothetical protein [bacterium]
MKKITIIAIAALTIGLVSGCGGKDTPFTVDAGGNTGNSGDATVVPGNTETIAQGTDRSSDEAILPTRTDTISDFGSPETPAPEAPAAEAPEAEAPAVAESTPDIGTPPSPPSDTGVAIPVIPGVDLRPSDWIPLPVGAIRIIPAVTLPSQHDQDVAHLMNDTFQPGEFTAYETEVQGRIVAERAAVTDAEFASALKGYVKSVLHALIDAERNNADVFRQRTARLGEIIAAFKSGNVLTAMNSVYDGALSDRALWSAAAHHPDLLKQAGSYLEIQFAEAYKDCAKASFDARQEVREQSSLVQGGEGLYLVYKPDGIIDAGWNHIRDFDFADFWYEGSSNWRGLAEGIRSALNAELHPVDAAAAARALEEMGRSIREQADRTADAIVRW